MEHLLKHFPALTARQREQFTAALRLYPEWNAKINVISRKDIDNLEVNHILHSLSIAKFINFTPGTRVLDLGTGGGFPAVPLAVMFPETQFLLVDRVAKKLRVADDIAAQTGLTNVTTFHGDVREVKEKVDFVISRAVMPLPELEPLAKRLIDRGHALNAIPNGLICLKGGDLDDEIAKYRCRLIIDDLSTYFDEPFFATKRLLYLPINT